MDEEKFAIDAIPNSRKEILTNFQEWDYAQRLAWNIQYGEVRLHIADGIIKFIAVSYSVSNKN